jgi:hypothetical protein
MDSPENVMGSTFIDAPKDASSRYVYNTFDDAKGNIIISR